MNTPDPTPQPEELETSPVPIWKREPVAIFGGIQTVLVAVVSCLFVFDVWHPSSEQLGALGGLYTALTGLFVIVIRGQVTPTGNVALTEEQAEFLRTIQQGI